MLIRSPRRWVLHHRVIWPFLWHGFLPVIGLLVLLAYALGPLAHRDIETNVLEQVRADLDAHDFKWVRVSAISGQDLMLGGVEPVAGAGAAALALARATRCATWAGPLVCPVNVDGAFSELPPVPEAESVSGSVSTPSAAIASCEQSLAGIVAASKIEFSISSDVIKPRSAPVLDALAAAAKECPGVLRVEGHTDSTGTDEGNQSLSEARAAAVREALASRGIEPARLTSQGFGAARPLADNGTAAGRALNRRIEFRVVADP